MSSGVTGEGGELVRESARDSETLPLDSSSEPRTSDAEKPCSGPGVHSDAVTAQIQGTEANSLPRAAVSSQSERKACVSTGATPGDEVVDSMPDKVAAAGKEDTEEGSVMWEDVEEEELSDTSSMMMDETLTSPQEPQGAEKPIQLKKAGPIPAPRLKRVYDTAGVGGSESSTSAAAEDNTGSENSKWSIVSKKHKSKVKGLMSSGVTGEGGELVRESARDSETLPLDSSSEPRTSDAEKPCSGPGVHSDAVTAQIQGTEANSLPRAAVSSQSERKACVSTGATPGDEVVDSMPDKVAAAGKEDTEEGSVMWEDVEEEELSDTSSMMMDETLTSPQDRSKVYSVEQIVSFLNKTKGVRGVVQKEYFPNDQLFIYSAKTAMRKATLNKLDQKQRYRLKKLVSERKKMINEEKKKTK
ncbi:UNVERIFIED_CONTAM: hypothetical protein FKN15_028338 [Acipenser sinensis]